MACRAACFALMLATLSSTGCGTIANVANSRTEEGGRIPFGGTKHDLAFIRGAANGEFGYRGHARFRSDADEEYPRTALTLMCAADLPLSAVADTVLWPYTCAYTQLNQPVPYPPVTIGEVPPAQGTATSPKPVANPTAAPPKTPAVLPETPVIPPVPGSGK